MEMKTTVAQNETIFWKLPFFDITKSTEYNIVWPCKTNIV